MCSSRHTRLKARGPTARLGLRALARQPGPLKQYCACAFLLLCLSACALGGAAPPDTGGSGVSLPPGLLGSPQQPAGSIGLRLDVQPDSTSQGTRFAATLSVSDAALLYQLSCRVAYDRLALRPVLAERGGLVDGRAVFFAPLDTAPDYVPLAFTYHPGESIPAAEGSLARIEFEVLDASRDPGLRLISDPQYLVARTALNQPLTVELGGAR